MVNRPRGEAQRFADTLSQYQKETRIYGSDVTRYRLYTEAMEKVLSRAKKYIVEPAGMGDGCPFGYSTIAREFVVLSSEAAMVRCLAGGAN